ncbi:DUF6286 domain-containing protein [Spirillospora sp. CA-294931]|uniref:DUF6286 domain-containing protein n=1 Tax=Spirillospora sp. CA-294931 TaxID=3240042 RepID=UPI003D8A2D13
MTAAPAPRAARRRVVRALRPRRGLAATLAAAVVAAVAALAAAEIIGALAGRPPNALPVSDLARLGRETRWDDPLALAVAGAAAAAGLVALLLALRPGRPRLIPLAPEGPHVVIGLAPSGLRRRVASAAESVDGIARVRVKAGRRRVRVRATSPLRDASGLTDQVRDAVRECVGELAPLRMPRVRVTVRHRED